MFIPVELLAVMVVTATACALPGVFLFLRRLTLISDAISHVLLFGIVVAYVIVGDLRSPWLLVGATLTGVLTVTLVELLERSGKIRGDAAIGLVFPTLFALGVVFISLELRNTHLDVDRVLLGSPEFAIRRRCRLFGIDWGPYSLLVMAGVLLLNLTFLVACWKELKLATFDPASATAFGFRPGLLHYVLMTLVSLTAVSGFDAVGPVMVVALMIVPAATARLLTDRLDRMVAYAALTAISGAILGTIVAASLDANTAGATATMLGVQFGLVALLTAPRRR